MKWSIIERADGPQMRKEATGFVGKKAIHLRPTEKAKKTVNAAHTNP